MRKPKRKTRKKQHRRWLYPVLFGVLAMLLGALIWPNYSQYNVNKNTESDMPVYEDIQVQPPQVAALEPEPIVPKTVDKKTYQYDKVKQHGIALIMDDVGYNLPALKRVLDLDFPVAISIIPDAPHAREAAEMAHKAGDVVMLHMPMEPSNPHYRKRMDDSFLRGDMPEEMVQSMLLHGLAKVPYAKGLNNHMGSFLTSMPEPMAWVMKFCREHQLFFVDSKTSSKSVASEIAASYGLVWGARRVFLDNSVKEVDMKKAWLSAERCAKRQGGCIVIAHPHPETLAFLETKRTYLKSKVMRVVVDLLHVPK
ncbi:MAG: divergent polysaccharide deacetylase family protein [Mariprofundaceae bacterium]|nr:divergent polysaccharide deacetylase family protein [Mariprofundaceae bacterium]